MPDIDMKEEGRKGDAGKKEERDILEGKDQTLSDFPRHNHLSSHPSSERNVQ